MTVLILGCKGNLGHQLMGVYEDLQSAGLVGWGREDLDITDEQAVWDRINELKPDLVYNCAAFNDVDKAEEDRAFVDIVNGYAPGYVAKACKAVGAKLVHYSTGMVFSGDSSEGNTEDDPPNPVNAYGRSKLQGEMEAQENCDDLYIIRTSWLYGPHGPGHTNKKSFIQRMIENAESGKELVAVEDEIGQPTYTLDLAQASRALVEEEKEFGVYHLTNSGNASRLDWAREAFKIKGMSAEIKPIKRGAFARMARRPHYEVLNNTKFLELRPWTEALTSFLS
jgi:dTDP-4-dehydrorhamnose reductase